MITTISVVETYTWVTRRGQDLLAQQQPCAFLDVREPGQFGEGHPLFAVPLPFSEFECRLPQLVKALHVPVLLIDSDDGVAARAAVAAQRLGYTDVRVCRGGVMAWAAAGYTLYQGVNVPSKVFGEIVEHQRDTPSITAQQLKQMQQRGRDLVLLDGRPWPEFKAMSIPSARCCPNAELPLRIDSLVASEDTVVVINCAGRTRSIIGAQMLIDSGVAQQVYALENGTQGWTLAGFELDWNKVDANAEAEKIALDALAPQQARRRRLEERFKLAGGNFVDWADVQASLQEPSNAPMLLLDVRTEAEFSAACLPFSQHAPGGQLVQATDQWVAIRGARIVLFDTVAVRALGTACWLRQLGHVADVLDPDSVSATAMSPAANSTSQGGWSASHHAEQWLRQMQAEELPSIEACSTVDLVLDVRSSAAFNQAALPHSQWVTRSRWRTRLTPLPAAISRVAVLGPVVRVAAMVAELRDAGYSEVSWIACDAELPASSMMTTAPVDADATHSRPVAIAEYDRIDFLQFTATRHQGDRAASLQYLEWEQNLVAQLDPVEAEVFSVLS